MTHHARITALVEFRQGDGANLTIPIGPCDIDETAQDATISWSDVDSRGAASMPLADYRRYVASQAIEILGVKTPPAPDGPSPVA